MHFSKTFITVALMCKLGLAAVVTQVEYVTQYQYQEVNVLVDTNGNPYSTQTITTYPTSKSATPNAPKTPNTPPLALAQGQNNVQLSHSHQAAPNYNYVTSTASDTPQTSTTTPISTHQTESHSTAAQQPIQTTSDYSKPAVISSTSTTSSTLPSKTTSSSSPENTSGSGSFSGDATFYDVGLGACGITNSDSELIAALNVDQFNQFGSMSNGNPVCGKKAKLNYQGKSVTVTIQDKCMGCKYGDLDLSPAAFKQLADEGVGRFKMTWSFV